MPAGYHSVDLSRFALRAGEGRKLELDVDPGELELGGERYVVRGDTVHARLDLSRATLGSRGAPLAIFLHAASHRMLPF
jgi:hypothetical protein